MIRVRCDRCQKLLEVDDELAGRKVECPGCGDVNVIPAPTAVAGEPGEDSAVRVERAVEEPAAKAPTAPPRPGEPVKSGPREHRVALIRPAMFGARPFSFLGLVLLVLAGAGGLIYFGPIQPQAVLMWASLAVLVAALVTLGVWKIHTMGEGLEITSRRVIEREGLLSRSVSEIYHQNITNLTTKQSFSQRLLRVGEIGISSSAQDGIEIVMKNCPNPEQVRALIDQYRG